MKVPSAVAIAVEISAISTELVNAFDRSGSENGCSQWRSVKPCQVKLNRPLLSLNENRTTMKTGMNGYSSASADQMPRTQLRRPARDAPPPEWGAVTPSATARPAGGAASIVT